ncbi:MAG: patatin family protein [Eubacteriales bacterium]|nr:patatin family protein [Eubacteriales bacterium]
MKTGVVDVGGGLRGIYAAGVFDYCLDAGIRFDVCIGVSAGSANIASYLAGQRGRNYQFYSEYSFRKKYMSFRNFVFKKSYIDMNYLYGTLSNSTGENPLDYPKIVRNPSEMLVVASNAQTGKPAYFNKNDLKQDNYSILKASCSIPFVCRPYEIEGIPYYDGALSDPVPVEKAFQYGCDKVVVILTKPEDFIRDPGKDEKFAKRIQKKYPVSAENLRQRAEKYNREVELAKQYRDQGRVLIIAPDDTCGVDTLTRDREALKCFYRKGYEDAQTIEEFLKLAGKK